MKNKIFLIVLFSAIPTFFNILNPGIVGIPSLVSYLLILIVFFRLYKSKEYDRFDGQKYLKIWFFILLIGAIKALFLNYASYSGLRDSVLSFFYSVPLLFVLLSKIENIYSYLKSFLLVFIPCAVYSSIKWEGFGFTDVAHVLSPIAFFVLFVPFLPGKWKWIILSVSLFSLLYDLSVRSNVLSLFFSYFVLLLFYLKNNISWSKITNIICLCCIVVPFIFLYLGASGTYNIFQEMMSENIKLEVEGRKQRGENYLIDSRTGVYIDVLSSIDDVPELIFGASPVTKFKTLMAKTIRDYRSGRNKTESGFLNILKFYGLIGVFSFLALNVYASYLGLSKSRNNLSVVIALFIAFKILYIFVEDPDIPMITYFAIGFCLNPKFRNMTDNQIIHFFALKR